MRGPSRPRERIDADRAAVLAYVSANREVAVSDIAAATGIELRNVKDALRELRLSGDVECLGRSGQARWIALTDERVAPCVEPIAVPEFVHRVRSAEGLPRPKQSIGAVRSVFELAGSL